ncbi:MULTISPECIES: uroporphyrinogen-III synthase [unclassified Marinovum]
MRHDTPALLLTRPRADSAAFLADLSAEVALGPVVISPVLYIRPTGLRPDMTGMTAVIFTSTNGVAAYKGPRALPAYCVGRKTTEAANAAGFQAVMAGETAEALIDTQTKTPLKGPVIHLRGAHTRGNIAARLTEAGVAITQAVLYDQQPMDLTIQARALLDEGRPVILPVFSPRSADILAQQGIGKAPLWVVALSQAVADRAADLAPDRLIVAKRPDRISMCAAVAALYRNGTPLEGAIAVP